MNLGTIHDAPGRNIGLSSIKGINPFLRRRLRSLVHPYGVSEPIHQRKTLKDHS